MTTHHEPKSIRKQIRLDPATAELLALLAAETRGNESAAIRRSIRLAAATMRRRASGQAR